MREQNNDEKDEKKTRETPAMEMNGRKWAKTDFGRR